MKPFILLILLLVGCSTTREISTMQGLRILSDVELSSIQLQKLDNGFNWALEHGLKAQPSQVTIIIREGVKTPNNDFGLASSASETGFAGGRTLSFEPIMIELPQKHLDNLTHEFFHCILQQQDGNSDPNHLNPKWKKLGLY